MRRKLESAPRITGCIVVRDEAEVLAPCLESIQGAVAEILVVDHGSRDDTADVARAHGARVLRSDAPFHEQARNAYLEAASTEWAFVIDADERLSDAGCSALPDLVRAASPEVLGFALERFDWVGGGRWASTRLVRLFRVDPRIRYFPSRAHTAVAPAIVDLGGTIGFGEAPLHHIDALLPRNHAAKRAGMRARLAREIADGGPAILRCFLALERFAIEEDASAEALLAEALAQDGRCEPIVRLFRAQQHLVRGRIDAAEREARNVLALAGNPRFRGRASAFVVVADALERKGKRDAAVAMMRDALLETPGLASHHLNLAALLRTSAAEEAREHFERALRANPWLLNPITFGEGCPASIFRQQDALLACVDRGDRLAALCGLHAS